MPTRAEWEADPVLGVDAPAHRDDYLFHYTTVERAAAIALHGSLILSPLASLNDPREARNVGLMTVTVSEINESPAIVQEHERQSVEEQVWSYRAGLRVACFTVDRRIGGRGTARRGDGRGFARSRMWAMYGDRHRGACLVFDRQELLSIASSTFGDGVSAAGVTYCAGFDNSLADAETVQYPNPNLDLCLDRALKSLFRKNRDWSGEGEFRIVTRDATGVTQLPVRNAVRGVVFGCDLPAHHLPIARAAAEALGVQEHAALLVPNNNVLQAWPIMGPDGEWHVWTDDDTRRSKIFSPEDQS